MPKRLSTAEVRRYREEGSCFPVTVMTPEQAAGYLERLDRAAAAHAAEAEAVLKIKSHLVFGCLDELLHLPAVLDAVEDILGPNILAWSSSLFAKDARDPRYVSWHQDLAYWGLEPPCSTSMPPGAYRPRQSRSCRCCFWSWKAVRSWCAGAIGLWRSDSRSGPERACFRARRRCWRQIDARGVS